MEELYCDFKHPGSARRASGLSLCHCLFNNRVAVQHALKLLLVHRLYFASHEFHSGEAEMIV